MGDKGGLTEAAQFPDIARPVVPEQNIHGLLGAALHFSSAESIKMADKMLHQQRDVLFPVSEG